MITVVSGVPRSGTSLMMQMLAAGGMELLTDGVRAADEDNLRGYFEWEPVKRLPRELELIAAAEGKAVKVVSALVWALPADREYRVIYMERPLEEVAASQAVMIGRRGAQAPALEGAALIAALRAHQHQVLAQLGQRAHIALCLVHYHQLLATPREEAQRIRDFLGLPLEVEAMARQVEPSLHRQRRSE